MHKFHQAKSTITNHNKRIVFMKEVLGTALINRSQVEEEISPNSTFSRAAKEKPQYTSYRCMFCTKTLSLAKEIFFQI